ncbi:TonB-dependent receptor plug domain-containing protein [Arachidicoccus sp.]|uniref:TonB-dependent receptor plug domain-containing protein n=1 Tax=Arachidicoccus sp. TaxID=1872624 RepID=UPI003D230142
MQNIVLYLIKVVVCSGILYAYYLLALRNKNFHPYNRFYLLITAALSFLLPLLHLSMFDISSNNEKMLAMMRLMYGGSLPDVVVGSTGPTADWQQLLLYASVVVMVILLILILIRVVRIYQLKKAFPRQKVEGIDFINTDIENAPFSFMKNLFWRNDIELGDAIGEQIYRHEMAHIRQKHSLDKIFFQILRAIFWMNPIYYFMKKELLLIHEFIADKKAVQNNDGEAFAQMLLRTQMGKFNFEPAHPLFYSTIKKRLLMITNSKKPKYSYLRRLLVLPLLGCVTFAFAFRAHKMEVKKNENAMQNLINVLQQQKDTTSHPTLQLVPVKGRITGLRLVQDGNLPPDNKSEKSFGYRLSTDGSQPLYVIDGLPAKDKNALSAIPANKIESISILKNEGARAIYGDRAKDGVVLVVTKNKVKSANDTNKIQTVSVTDIKRGTPPLVFVDGIKKDFDVINTITPPSIASINVLKSEKAIEKYGAEGKNGVIEITTKDKGQHVFTINYYNKDSSHRNSAIEFTSVQHPATFPGGTKAWQGYLVKNLNSRIPAEKGAPTGTYFVIVSFLIDKNGNISEVKAIHTPKPAYGMGTEAERVIKTSGKWNPAVQNGHDVTYRQTQKIVFSVTE